MKSRKTRENEGKRKEEGGIENRLMIRREKEKLLMRSKDKETV